MNPLIQSPLGFFCCPLNGLKLFLVGHLDRDDLGNSLGVGVDLNQEGFILVNPFSNKFLQSHMRLSNMGLINVRLAGGDF